MWKKLIIGVVGIMASSAVQETEAFSSSTTNIHPTTHKSSSINTQSTTALSESFYNYGKDAPDGEYNNVNGGAAEQPTTQKSKGFFANFFEELDAFVDDATSRRLGNGAQYYGKRKSSFYGENDVNKKRDRVSMSCVIMEHMKGFSNMLMIIFVFPHPTEYRRHNW